MDLAIRQKLLQALAAAQDKGNRVVLQRKDDALVVKCDLVCYETTIEATGDDGIVVSIPYEDVVDVRAAKR